MHFIEFKEKGIKIEVEEGTSILAAARKAGVMVEAPCNGAGVCGKCRIKKAGIEPLSAVEIKKEIDDDHVLACQTLIRGDVTVSLEENKETGLEIVSEGKSLEFTFDLNVRKEYEPEKDRTAVWVGDNAPVYEEGNTEDALFGVVVDIGTTTLVAALMDMHTGKELASASALNPQARYGQDVLSRIHMASEEEGLNTLYSEVISEISRMTEEICKEAGKKRENIYEIILSGNTCMIHLATGTSPKGLGSYPYIPNTRGGAAIKASDIRLDIAEEGLAYLPPIISAYVGPDITSGILVSELPKKTGITLFVDIGTNGEMAIARDGEICAASTAAGPAFEGMNIEFGMRAAKGAGEYFDITETGITVKTIGGSKAEGICGSGLLDIVGELVRTGVIGKNGRFVKKEKASLPEFLSERLQEYHEKTGFLVAEEVFLTQKDIRQVQLAKGAVRSGIEFLMKQQGITAGEVDRVLIAGSFGFHLRSESLINIGMLPREFEGKIEYVGNTSKTGGAAFLLNRGFREEALDMVSKIKTIELADDPDFEKVFVECLNF